MSNKFSVILVLVVLCGLTLAPMIASADTVAYSLLGLNLNNLTGTFDIVDQAVVFVDPQVTYTDLSGTFTGVTAIRQACEDSLNNAAGPFAGAGLVSSASSADWVNYKTTGEAPITGIGWLYNDYDGQPIYNSFFGMPTPLNCLILRYTYMGDTLLRGFVDNSDLARMEMASNSGIPGGWMFGDFQYTGGVPSSVDYQWADANYEALAMNGLGGDMASLDYPGALAPEPASIGMLFGGLVAVLFAKRVRRRAW